MSKSERFHAHYNEAMGRMIHTKDDYLKGMKEMNLIPQREAKQIAEAKRKEAERPKEVSKWAHEMVEASRRSNGNPGSAWYSQLEKRGVSVKQINQLREKAERTMREGKNGFR